MALSRSTFDGGRSAPRAPSSGTTLRAGRGILPKPNSKPASPASTQREIPTPPPAPTYDSPSPSTYLGSANDYSGGGGSATESLAASAPAQTDEDFLAGDAGYIAQMAALKAALDNFGADQNSRRSRYGTDFDESMTNLGWNSADNPDTVDVNEKDTWNWNDTNYAAGRARQNTENDFASRGMMQSSLFGEATNNLERSLNDQRGGMVKAKKGFEDDLTSQAAAYGAENTLSTSQAKIEALARRAAQIGI